MKYSPVSSPSPIEQLYGSPPTSPLPPVRAVTATFDGRVTIPKPKRLVTPSRSRRSEIGAGGCPSGKDAFGIPLPERLALKELYLSPPRSPAYVNDTKGNVRLATYQVEAPQTAPKRGEFCRLAVASSKGGVFARNFAGCLPWTP
eukprot:CAMPEP_0177724000 /NCGR_PEP_ID=MMETSP0484_2-20121128/18500_1 /TAXON_ID=354590 /ORGANISM="Rhodomonas lens, Strain RHODO" /LENGTH=144 /DNA_ID=CAMNT_0019236449 /DNA_START=295 /DNA_END=729 /DNA_ORIENTATION=-